MFCFFDVDGEDLGLVGEVILEFWFVGFDTVSVIVRYSCYFEWIVGDCYVVISDIYINVFWKGLNVYFEYMYWLYVLEF